MNTKRITAMLIAITLMLCTVPLAYASPPDTWSTVTLTGETMSIRMDQGEFAVNLEVSRVIDYEFIDNTASVAEYVETEDYDDGSYSFEFANAHIITVKPGAAITFIDFEYNNAEASQIFIRIPDNPKLYKPAAIRMDGAWHTALRPSWTYHMSSNTFTMAEGGIHYIYNNATDGEKAEVFIFQTVGEPDDYTPPIDREPVWSNPSGGAYDYQLGRAPISNYYGEIQSNGRLKYEVPGVDHAVDADPGDQIYSYSLFITEDGTIDIYCWVQFSGTYEELYDDCEVYTWDYTPVWSGADVYFEQTGGGQALNAIFLERTVTVSGFFKYAETLIPKEGTEGFGVNWSSLVGIVLSEAQVEEYRKTGTIAEYPDFDWSVLGGIGDNTTPQPDPEPESQPEPKPEPQPEPQPEAQPEPQPNVYIVQRGDYLIKIARMYGTTWQVLQRLNNIKNPNLIYPGQVIILP